MARHFILVRTTTARFAKRRQVSHVFAESYNVMTDCSRVNGGGRKDAGGASGQD
jgi:hypothetical protein